MRPETGERLKRQQYRMIGSHSAVKVCHWTKKSLLDEGVCYKQAFYGIPSHRCCQMTPCMVCCNRCVFCWRDIDSFTGLKISGRPDEPREIIDNAIKMQRHLLNGFPGNPLVNRKKLSEAQDPKSFAISLSGEPTMYPSLGEMIGELKKRKVCSFLVSNGLFPERIENLGTLPTQLYISLDAPNRKVYQEVDRPLISRPWERFQKTLELLPSLGTRTVLRITAVKGLNMTDPEGYAALIKKAGPVFVEVKGYSWVGASRARLKEANMPSHGDVKAFAAEIAGFAGLEMIDEKAESAVVLLAEKDSGKRRLKL